MDSFEISTPMEKDTKKKWRAVEVFWPLVRYNTHSTHIQNAGRLHGPKYD